jgi:hypothetical protein
MWSAVSGTQADDADVLRKRQGRDEEDCGAPALRCGDQASIGSIFFFRLSDIVLSSNVRAVHDAR